MNRPPLYTGPTAADLDRIPEALTTLPQWVLWRGADTVIERTGEVKLTKIPIDPQTLRKASTTDLSTWGAFAHCVAALPIALEEWESTDPDSYRGGGIGFVFTDDDPYVGIDLDACVDPTTHEVAPWAQAHVDALASYAERTPSGTGLHILVEGTLPPKGRKKGNVEMYSYARFFTMTGWHLADTPPIIASRQDALTAMHTAIFDTPQPPHAPTQAVTYTLDDADVLTKTQAAKNGSKFAQLWAGETALHGGDESSADMALCVMLAFWTQDTSQIDRLFRQSGLMRPKWDEMRGAQTYGARTIAEALAWQTEHYRPARDPASPRNGTTPGPAGGEPPLPYSDYTNALAFVREHGHLVRYCYPWKAWLVWTGTHWERDMSGWVMRLAKQTVKRLARQVEDLDDAEAKALMAHIKSSLSTAKLKAMVECAQSEPGIAVQPEELDRDPWLLNVTNGTLDLRTGTLRSHDRTDLLTVALPVTYDRDAPCPLWDAFVHRIMGGNQNLMQFLQRAIGYALTGVIREHVLLIFWGTGRNGKSTFLNTLRVLLCFYAMKAPSELLMVSNNDRHPTERADLFGKRFVAAIETERGRRLAEVFVKEATGGDPIRARRMREDFWEFQPTHKVFLATNHKPVIKGTDTAIWERIRLVPFTVTIPKEERDTGLPDKLLKELPGILAWAVQGCLAWQQEGLGEPEEVMQATAGYRLEMDVLGQFIDECCVVGKDYRVKASMLYDAYKRWCDEQGETPAVQRSWGMALTERGLESSKTNGRSWWKGIGLLQPSTDDEDEAKVDDVDEGRRKNGKKRAVNFREAYNPEISSTSSTSSTRETCHPAYCPGCARPTTWLIREGFVECYKCHIRVEHPTTHRNLPR